MENKFYGYSIKVFGDCPIAVFISIALLFKVVVRLKSTLSLATNNAKMGIQYQPTECRNRAQIEVDVEEDGARTGGGVAKCQPSSSVLEQLLH